ncbi:unnamed protein product [[Candida] boidinii]|nr:unnamed protein product [[Candida] boidinii]
MNDEALNMGSQSPNYDDHHGAESKTQKSSMLAPPLLIVAAMEPAVIQGYEIFAEKAPVRQQPLAELVLVQKGSKFQGQVYKDYHRDFVFGTVKPLYSSSIYQEYLIYLNSDIARCQYTPPSFLKLVP